MLDDPEVVVYFIALGVSQQAPTKLLYVLEMTTYRKLIFHIVESARRRSDLTTGCRTVP